MDHVNNYKPPKDDDKLDEETKRLQTEGCAPKPQLPPEAIKREPADDNIVGGVRLPQRLPIRTVKSESEIKKEKTHKVSWNGRTANMHQCKAFPCDFQVKKEKKEKKSKKSKKDKKSKRRKSTSSSNNDSGADSDDSDRHRKRKESKSKR